MTDTSAPNLFAAAKSYGVAMARLLPDFEAEGPAAAIAMPFYLLAGFAIELSLKAVVLRTHSNVAELRKLGHDLDAAFRAATTCGFTSSDHGEFGKLVARLSPIHKGLVARYVPDVPVIDLPGPMLVLKLLADHFSDVERQFDVWGNLVGDAEPQGASDDHDPKV
jgi:hypothetical protein